MGIHTIDDSPRTACSCRARRTRSESGDCCAMDSLTIWAVEMSGVEASAAPNTARGSSTKERSAGLCVHSGRSGAPTVDAASIPAAVRYACSAPSMRTLTTAAERTVLGSNPMIMRAIGCDTPLHNCTARERSLAAMLLKARSSALPLFGSTPRPTALAAPSRSERPEGSEAAEEAGRTSEMPIWVVVRPPPPNQRLAEKRDERPEGAAGC
mmetsp:Transcript_25682/g.51560  ORF Transcript_25682/g.51560 Transcript_25682/m.51560 type:complete len:211 (-) Transcript_25682:357-989(-)